MLSADSAAIVRATLPVVGASLDAITARFYETMFAERPELLDGLFNRGNQANGEQRRALAGSIASFATMLLEHPDERPDHLLARIAHKHTAVGVTDDQYVIVHKYLFGAIAEVLGEAVTPEVAAAWDEVYWLMAGALIAMEARIYAEAGAHNGATWRQWRVVARRDETPDAVSFLLRPADDGPVPPARPGQYVSVRVRMPDGVHQLRQYTLSSVGDLRRITVKCVDGDPAGEVSTLLHTTVRAGDELTLSAPFGDVTLEDGNAPLVLVSAGIGCTPIVAMLDHLAATGSRRRVLVLHADRSRAEHALREDTLRLAAERIFWYETGAAAPDREGLMDLDGVDIPAGAVAYLCGPVPFMRDIRGQLLKAGVAARDIHYEVFGPDLWLAAD
ncbi:Flavohemoprotein (Hemoglobin-like protein) (Flavohemoglobin) (Nitric oxide dioxygenase) [[Actinomadura] parvosata subsp. kistnae]|uniref:nitric oxide dioxygenase n=1 Tax=[Actinomadura] parvosata subsp. kistnae TaxID=1909395 RepID=A0A1U9ZYZ9_9ACTN|nr:globin domain-containing protein [Nonomuraea sp. ATCC 55076]AQZ63149.1 hemin transporter [Nonomuraea sp. ATCC 55076]SPL98795.1 Flavohemoprotein (Hemoglobin-like protein) (Flavohemoglobin) (Nitric oxide dioxygenase) [Actinomadura parvosata subsp. kistnae]